MIPGPRPPEGPDRPPAGREPGPESTCASRIDIAPTGTADADAPVAGTEPPLSPVTLTRTSKGWTVVSPTGAETAGDLIEGLSLADLVAEETGTTVEPDRTARRSARGPARGGEPDDSPEGRIATLQRTVAQLEHALAARVSTERAIGVLAERNRTSPRAAFDRLRSEARSSGRPVAELARLVLDGLAPLEPVEPPVHAAAADGRP